MHYRLLKPELILRPQVLMSRILRTFSRPHPQETVRLPWGLALNVSPTETIGRQVCAFGLFDLIVCEALFRLSEPGEMAIDAGANIGQMTGLLACRVGPKGCVWAIEPHPEVRRDLQRHVEAWQRSGRIAPIHIKTFALAEVDQEGELSEPAHFEVNRGMSSIGDYGPGSRRIPIAFKRLDSILPGGQKVGVLKVDVEGAEERVLRGASEALTRRQIRDVLFEDHGPYPSSASVLLEARGYTLFSLGLSLTGLVIQRSRERSRALRPWDSPSFLATADPDRAESMLVAAGWRCLRAP